MNPTPYTDQAAVEGYLGRTLEDGESAIFSILEEACEDIIDGYCARSFSAGRNTESTVDPNQGDGSNNPFQLFDGQQNEIFFDQPLQVDPTAENYLAPYIGYRSTDTGTWSPLNPNDYIFYPLNKTTKTSVMSRTGSFGWGLANVYVYGNFGDYVSPPSGIQLAATIMAADIINLPDGITQESIEGYSRSFSADWNPTIQKILDIYKRVVL